MRVFHGEDSSQAPQQEWAIKGILPKQQITIVQGKAGIGKTFLLLDWALCCASDKPWVNHATTHGHVVYVSAFGLNRLGPRLRAWVKYHQQGRDVLQSIGFVDVNTSILDSETTQR